MAGGVELVNGQHPNSAPADEFDPHPGRVVAWLIAFVGHLGPDPRVRRRAPGKTGWPRFLLTLSLSAWMFKATGSVTVTYRLELALNAPKPRS